MKIKYLGHSSFLLTSAAGARIVCDPFSSEIGIKMPKVEADIITLSHRHYDHAEVDAVGGNPKVLEMEADLTYKDVRITAVKSYHDNLLGARRGENTIFRFSTEGFTVCHLGDLGEDITEELAQRIGRADVLLIPVGGTYTINATAAKKLIGMIKPNVVIPMHYKVEGCNIDIVGADLFLLLYNNEKILNVGSETELTPATICEREEEIWLMSRSL